MKKFFLLPLLLFLLLSLVGCKSSIKLETGQSLTTFNNKGALSITTSLSSKDARDLFDVRIKDSKKDIKEDLIDHFSYLYDEEIKVTKLKKGKDFVNFTFTIDDAELFGFYDDLTLEDYAYDYYYDLEDMAEYEEFVTYKKDESLDSDDLIDYEDDFVQYVHGGNEGAYYKTPKKILLVSDNLKYKKISNDTIFIRRNSSGIIVYKK